MKNQVIIFDTTLRDGEQSPGATMTTNEKLEVAGALAQLGVNVIEAGFPAASPDDFKAVSRVAETHGRGADAPLICGLARASQGDIDAALRALESADHPRVHTFLATSPIHRDQKLRMSKEEVLARIDEMVRYATERCGDVEFSAEDAGRTEPEFLHQAVRVAIQAGATTINIPDTVGYTQPAEYGAIFTRILAEVPEAKDVVLSVHCHDDLGLAVANTLAGLTSGARQAEVAVNGIGERAGNAALEEIVMALQTRSDLYGFNHSIDSRQLSSTSRLVSRVTGMDVQPNKAIVGRNAFAHESGIHQDGMIKNQETYEIMRPESVGAPRTELVLGKHSGRRALGQRLSELGIELSGSMLDHAFARFKKLADRRKQVTDADLLALVRDEGEQEVETYRLAGLRVSTGNTETTASALVTIAGPRGEREVSGVGCGPIDAALNAINECFGRNAELTHFKLQATGSGSDALGEATVSLKDPSGRNLRGYGCDQDVVVASAKAYLSAFNKSLAGLDDATRDLFVKPNPAEPARSAPTDEALQ